MSQFNSHSARSALALCTLLVLSLGTSACMGGRGMGMGMNHEMMGTHATLHSMLMTANRSEIEEAQLALTKTQNPAVRQFAQRMIADHTAAMQQMEQMMMQMGMDRAMMDRMMMENPTVQQMQATHMQTMQVLRNAEGMAFDRTYIDHQAAMHRYLVNTMDRMMPSMMSGEMHMDMAQNLRATLAAHQQMAEQIQASMRSM